MGRRILNLLQQDWTNALRDNILLYMMIAPILLALGARFFLPSLNENQYTFAVQAGMDTQLVERLDLIGNLEVMETSDLVKERVLRSDDVPGLILVNGKPTLVMEGNEGEEALTLQLVIEQALSGESLAEFTLTQAATSSRSLLKEYGAIIFILMNTLLGSLMMAFNIIEDKESKAMRALGVSPLSMLELTIARGLFALGISLVMVLISTTLLLGTQINYGLLIIGFFFSIALPVLSGYVIGGVADSQLKAIAILKFYFLVYLTLPIITIFIPQTSHFYFYWLPNYWMWHTFEQLFIGNLGGPGFWLSGLITLGSSLLLVIIVFPFLRRQLKLR
ncbi:MAG TPA: ABC transporter permease [Anaerolineaceae bacterium]|nr:ABC transporter permease [Anaerolineaceae bacterium]